MLGMGALATWADSEAVLPAYLIGMVLAGTVGKDHALIRRLRTLTFGLLTPFYFIRAGSFVSIPELVTAPAAFLLFLVVKVGAKITGVYPVTKDRWIELCTRKERQDDRADAGRNLTQDLSVPSMAEPMAAPSAASGPPISGASNLSATSTGPGPNAATAPPSKR